MWCCVFFVIIACSPSRFEFKQESPNKKDTCVSVCGLVKIWIWRSEQERERKIKYDDIVSGWCCCCRFTFYWNVKPQHSTQSTIFGESIFTERVAIQIKNGKYGNVYFTNAQQFQLKKMYEKNRFYHNQYPTIRHTSDKQPHMKSNWEKRMKNCCKREFLSKCIFICKLSSILPRLFFHHAQHNNVMNMFYECDGKKIPRMHYKRIEFKSV